MIYVVQLWVWYNSDYNEKVCDGDWGHILCGRGEYFSSSQFEWTKFWLWWQQWSWLNGQNNDFKVREKEEAWRKYKAAVEEGKTAGWEQNNEYDTRKQGKNQILTENYVYNDQIYSIPEYIFC